MRVTTVMVVLLFCTYDASAQVFTPTRAPRSAASPDEVRTLDSELIEARRDLEKAKTAEAVATSRAERAGGAPRVEVASAQTRTANLEQNVKALQTRRNMLASGAARRGSFLTQAALNGIANEDGPEVSIQAADLFFNDSFRVYLRSTLSTERSADEEQDDAEATEAGESESDAGAALEERIKSALLDPYGGLLYLTTGAFHQLLGENPSGQRPRGLFLDARGGVRAVQLEGKQQSTSNPIVPFATVSAGLQFQWPVWDDPMQTADDQSVGDVVFGLTWVGNAVLDKSVSEVFSGDDPVLNRWTHTVALSAGISLKGVAKLTFTGNPWSSSTALGKRFAVGLALVRLE